MILIVPQSTEIIAIDIFFADLWIDFGTAGFMQVDYSYDNIQGH